MESSLSLRDCNQLYIKLKHYLMLKMGSIGVRMMSAFNQGKIFKLTLNNSCIYHNSASNDGLVCLICFWNLKAW